jgi:myo-inositol 2-dehydrogenase/D-chiro-inositol 1-dehydrogenase
MKGGLRIGVVGCGGVAREHAGKLAELGNPPSGWFDSDPSRARALAEQFGGRALPSLDALVESSDAVIVATPPNSHAEQVVAAARAGRHIFCEKPLCLSLAEADSIGTALGRSRGAFMIGYVLRFFPAFRALHQVLASGELGGLVSISDRRISPRNYWETAWLCDPAISGGMTVEYFTHDLDWVLWSGGMPRRVLGRTSREYEGPGSAIEDNVWAWLDFARGSAVAEASWTRPQAGSLQEIFGTAGTARSDGGNSTVTSGGKTRALDTPGEDGYLAQMREFLACIREGRAPEPGFTAGRQALAVARAIQESSRTGHPVALDTR